jgi:aerobic carbon-monoxide dehydrogenase medium subunit
VKPAPFSYRAPRTVDEAVEALAEPGATVLAGGQSLLLELVQRQRHARLLVDINTVAGLDRLVNGPDGLVVGALVRHQRLEAHDQDADPVRRLLRRVAPYVAHPPIRTRGTFCGSIAWAHPAAEWNAVALAFDAAVRLRSRRGDRVVPVATWFRGNQQTAREPDELVMAVRLAPLPPRTGVGFAEHRRTHASFADVAVVAAVTLTDDGVVQRARLAAAGLGDRPQRLMELEEAMVGVEATSVAEWTRRQRVDVPGRDHQRAVAVELAARTVAAAVSPR